MDFFQNNFFLNGFVVKEVRYPPYRKAKTAVPPRSFFFLLVDPGRK